ncbi:RNA-directed DNA polymerase from mobile element jockey [Trichonephila clavipes]|nr:RNA-directed DNA polymerase from mobile element jockey [Trichonephila clavipes]
MLAPLYFYGPPTPAPSKDASVNAGLLKDLLTIIEDTPCIDKQVFCRAFKNSLSALRSASADVDKTKPGLSQSQIANYRLFKDDRIEFPHTVTRGGTAIYCKNEIVHNRIPLPAMHGIDAIAVQIKIKNAPPLNIISAYIRKSAHSRFPSEDFKKNFNSGSNCIIAGDFNASHVDWHNVKNTRYGVSLRNLVSNLRGAKLVAPQTATHLQPRQRFGSIIDLAVFKHIPYNHSVRVLSDLSSDHYPVKTPPSTDLTSNENIELAISELNQNFSEAFVEASKPKFKNAPKILSPEIKSKIHQRNRLRKFWQRSRCPSIYSEFRTLSREIAKDIKSHSQAQWEKHIEALSPEDNTLWRKSSLLRKPFRSIPDFGLLRSYFGLLRCNYDHGN